jgi:hypothetical protein
VEHVAEPRPGTDLTKLNFVRKCFGQISKKLLIHMYVSIMHNAILYF